MSGKMLNILLVEDDDLDVMNVQRAFKKNNILNPLYVAGNGLDALDMLRGVDGGPPDVPEERRLILLDLNMPKMNGIEFLRELRADPALSLDSRHCPHNIGRRPGQSRSIPDECGRLHLKTRHAGTFY